jgi:hypothetical protein
MVLHRTVRGCYLCVAFPLLMGRAALEELLFLFVDQAEFDRPNGCLGAVGDPELGDEVLDVVFDGAHGDREILGDLPVGLPPRQ